MKSRAEKILEQMVPTVRQFRDDVHDCLDMRRTGWFRLYVKIDEGVVKNCFTERCDVKPIVDVEDVDTETGGT